MGTTSYQPPKRSTVDHNIEHVDQSPTMAKIDDGLKQVIADHITQQLQAATDGKLSGVEMENIVLTLLAGAAEAMLASAGLLHGREQVKAAFVAAAGLQFDAAGGLWLIPKSR